MKTTIVVNGKNLEVKRLASQDDFDTHTTYFDGEVIEMSNGSAYILESDTENVFWLPKKYISCNPFVKVGYDIIIECAESIYSGKRIANSLVYVSDLGKNQVFKTEA